MVAAAGPPADAAAAPAPKSMKAMKMAKNKPGQGRPLKIGPKAKKNTRFV